MGSNQLSCNHLRHTDSQVQVLPPPLVYFQYLPPSLLGHRLLQPPHYVDLPDQDLHHATLAPHLTHRQYFPPQRIRHHLVYYHRDCGLLLSPPPSLQKLLTSYVVLAPCLAQAHVALFHPCTDSWAVFL